MDRIGLSFKSSLPPEEIRGRYIQPLREAIENARAGIYSNYLRQAEANSDAPEEHLLVFQVHDFQTGLRLLRVELEKIGVPGGAAFHNLDPSNPMY